MKFKDVDQSTIDLFTKVREEIFPELSGAMFKLIFRDKKKMSGPRMVFADIRALNDLNRFFSSAETNTENGYDYCVTIDEKIWNALEEEDKYRILRHELRHVVYDPEKKKIYSVRDHTIQDFHEDVEIEAKEGGDPYWTERVAEIGFSLYEQDDEDS